MNTFTVACLNHEICGDTQTFDSVEEFDIYGDDYICAECYAAEEYDFFQTVGWDLAGDL